jgi:hypothetical protein
METAKLLKMLDDREDEISYLQDDVAQLTERINLINKEHSEEIGICLPLFIMRTSHDSVYL